MYSSLYATCGLIPRQLDSFPLYPAICLFTAPQRLRGAPGDPRHRPTHQMPYRGWHLAVYVSAHPSLFAQICTYGQVTGPGLVSLQIPFGEIASWLLRSYSPSGGLVKLETGSSKCKCAMLQQHRQGMKVLHRQTQILQMGLTHTRIHTHNYRHMYYFTSSILLPSSSFSNFINPDAVIHTSFLLLSSVPPPPFFFSHHHYVHCFKITLEVWA